MARLDDHPWAAEPSRANVARRRIRALPRGLAARFRRRVPGPNVAAGWDQMDWLRWDAPVNIVREGHYQDALVGLCGEPCEQGFLIPTEVVLRREPQNRYDPNAIGVYVRDTKVGYIERTVAAQAAKLADRAGCLEWSVPGVIRGGNLRYDKFGVHLWPMRLLSEGVMVWCCGPPFDVTWPPSEEDMFVTVRKFGPAAPPADH